MKLKKIVAATVLAGALTVGTAGIASAEDTPTPTRPTPQQLCQRAKTFWERVQHLEERAQALHDKLTAARDKALAEGNTELAAKIDARLARMQERHDRIAARLQTLKEKGQGRCADLLDPAPSAS